ncbi:YczI family protein [Bacillus manliponensis]
MWKILKITLAIATLLLVTFSFFTDDNSLLPLIQMLIGIMLIVVGVDQIKNERKAMGIICIGVGIYSWGVQILKYLF